jgi:hypothetical protein
MVVDNSSDVNRPLKIPIPLVSVEFKPQAFHVIIVQQLTGFMVKKRLDFRIEEFEFQILEDYCEAIGRTKTDVLRELIRSLKTKKKPP